MGSTSKQNVRVLWHFCFSGKCVSSLVEILSLGSACNLYCTAVALVQEQMLSVHLSEEDSKETWRYSCGGYQIV